MKITTINFLRSILLLTAFYFLTHCQRKPDQYFISLEPESNASQPQILSFSLPAEMQEKNYHLEDSEGNKFPVQIDAKGKAWTVLKRTKTKEEELYLLPGKSNNISEGIKYKEEGNKLLFSINEKSVFAYQKAGRLPNQTIDSAFLRGGYIHPVYTPAEKIITDDYAANHLHHHGIWAAWTKTEFEGRKPDFWNMGDKTGKVDFVSLDSVFDGAVMAGFSATLAYIDLSASEPKRVLTETWDVKVFNMEGTSQPYYIFDVNIRQHCASPSLLILPTYRYGGIGFRGREEWNGEENTTFLTSEGKDRTNGHGTTARWCHVGGLVEGTPAGVAIMGHPDNFRAPQPMRIHPSEPFFNFAPSQAGDWAINPDEPYLAKYRFIVYDGEPDPDLLESLWQEYANPLEVVVEKK